MRLTGKNGGEVEAEAVDTHVAGPVAQAVHHHLQNARVGEVQRVAGAGVVDVVPRLGRQPVVGGIVDALEAERRSELVALGGVIVDHVEDHLEPGIVQVGDHLLELADRVAGGVARIRREEADGIIAPEIRQPLLQQMVVVDELVDRQKLDRGDAERHARDLMLVFPIIEECRILPVKIELRRLSPGRGIFFEAKGNPNSPK